MLTIIVFALITFFLIIKLNNIIGISIGFKIEKENLRDFAKEEIKEVITLDSKVQLIKKHYKSFDLDDFLQKAQKVFEIIFKAYAQEDKHILKDLLAPRTYKAFTMAIDDRKKRHETLEGSIESFSKIELLDAKIADDNILATVKFVTQQCTVLKGNDGKILEGGTEFVETHTDVWVFSRPISSNNNRWLLYEIKSED